MATIIPAVDMEVMQIIIDIHPSGELIIITPSKISTETSISILEASVEILAKRGRSVTVH